MMIFVEPKRKQLHQILRTTIYQSEKDQILKDITL